jgi:Na+/proline symporter
MRKGLMVGAVMVYTYALLAIIRNMIHNKIEQDGYSVITIFICAVVFYIAWSLEDKK